MTQFHSHARTIFTNKDAQFQGVDQGFDPHAEQPQRVPYAMDIDFAEGKLKMRDGYSKYLSYSSSVMGVSKVEFQDVDDGLAVLLGDGTVYYIEGI